MTKHPWHESHLSVLHQSALVGAPDKSIPFSPVTDHMQYDAAPHIKAEETPFGLHYAAIRNVDDKAETRVTAFLSPFWIRNPNGDLTMGCVPMNDEKTAFFHIWYDGVNAYGEDSLATKQSLHGSPALSHSAQIRTQRSRRRQAGRPRLLGK